MTSPTNTEPLDLVDPDRAPLPATLAISATVPIGDGRHAQVKRRPPRQALKGKVALAKFLGPTVARLIIGGVDINGTRIEALTLLSLLTKKGREAAEAEGIDVDAFVAAARRALPQLILDAISGETDPEQLEDLYEYYLYGATVVEVRNAAESDKPPVTWTRIDNGQQLDELLPSDIALGRLLYEAIALGLAPFGVGSTPPPSS